MKLILWGAAVVCGYLAWTASDLRERTGDLTYLPQAIGWGVAGLACVMVALGRKAGKGTGRKAKAKARG